MRGDVFLFCPLFVLLHSDSEDCLRGGGRVNLNSGHGACRRGPLRYRGVILGRSHMKRRAPYCVGASQGHARHLADTTQTDDCAVLYMC
ncbi:hypothetical protein EDB85DRAFT_1983520 [Lactarius pseudohatsudake]|nr:hypothetical protein EDB85DRAFT_1983520 [Lactarius pseudohatsudake]